MNTPWSQHSPAPLLIFEISRRPEVLGSGAVLGTLDLAPHVLKAPGQPASVAQKEEAFGSV